MSEHGLRFTTPSSPCESHTYTAIIVMSYPANVPPALATTAVSTLQETESCVGDESARGGRQVPRLRLEPGAE